MPPEPYLYISFLIALMNRFRISLVAVLLGLLALVGSEAAFALPIQQEGVSSGFRTWGDSTGVFSVDAKLLGLEGDTARLEKKDGRVVKLAIDKLSEADQAFIVKLQTDAKKKQPVNPFAGGTLPKAVPKGMASPTNSTAAESGKESKLEPVAKTVKVDVLVNEVQLVDGPWQVPVDPPNSAASPVPNTVCDYPSSVEHAFHDRQQTPKISFDQKFVVAAASNPFDDNTMLAIYELQSGEKIGFADLPIEDLNVMAIDANKRQVLTVHQESGRTPGKIEFRKFDQLSSPVEVWETSNFFDHDGFRPRFCSFVGKDRLLTVGKRLALWNVSDAKSIYSVKLKNSRLNSSQVAISPGRKYLAVGDIDAVWFIDLETGAPIGTIPRVRNMRALSFSPSGEYLAGLNVRGDVWIWDLAENSLAQSFNTSARHSLHWTDERHLIGDSRYLLDVEYRVCIWEYSGGGYESLVGLGDGVFMSQQKSKLVPIRLPHQDFSDKLDELDPEELLILIPGDEIAIDFELPFEESEQIRIRKSLEKRMAQAGFSINAKSKIVLKGRVTKGRETKTEIGDPIGFGLGFGAPRRRVQTVTYTPSRSTIEIIKDGKTIWRTSDFHGPRGIFRPNEGESLQDYADRVSRPKSALFLGFRIPTNRSTLPDGKPFGKSSLKAAAVSQDRESK